jgi:hypothetical protein
MSDRTPINSAKYRAAPQYLVDRILATREITPEGCWLWPGTTSHDGYGYVKYRHQGKRPGVYVHRLIYMRLIGDPGDMIELDHLCHRPAECKVPSDKCPHRRCVNPGHLDPVTPQQHGQRRLVPHCPLNHAYDEANTHIGKDGGRHCRECHRLAMAAVRATWSDEERVARNAATLAKRLAVKLAEERFCNRCGERISHRSRRAVYCEQCRPPGPSRSMKLLT